MNMVESKSSLRTHIGKFFSPNRHRSHYLKWTLTDPDWSIRYFWVFDSRPQYIRKWVLKSHKTKKYIEMSRAEALDYIRFCGTHRSPEEIQSVLANGKYHRQITKHKEA